ncbi:ribonuclease H-like domain-containing protein [Tanacetum coccineum]|uniref:Ribonuclease H-like domain-containing protein n=1 Tax=Tanacetum coccineum TaxID=301880 RepID=A0ABQ5EF67_9ASTR
MTGASGSNVDSISSLDAGNPLHLQTNDNNSGSLINLKLTGFENYRGWVTAMKIALQARNKIEFDILTKLAPCTRDAKTELGKHNQLMKLMQFLMGLDDVYLPIRSYLLNQIELPDVKDTFVIIYREESKRGPGSGSGKYSSGMPFTSDQIAKLISLIGDNSGNEIHANMADSGANQHNTSSTNNMTDVIDISDLNITVGHPNGIAAKIRKVENLKLTSNIDLKKENVLGTGSEAEGLYVFNTKCLRFLDFFNDPRIIMEQRIAAYKGYRGGGVVRV